MRLGGAGQSELAELSRMLQLDQSVIDGCISHGEHVRTHLDALDELHVAGTSAFKQLQTHSSKQKALAESHTGLSARCKKQLNSATTHLEQVITSHKVIKAWMALAE